MDTEVFFSEPGTSKFEIRDGLVFTTLTSGAKTVRACTTIAGFKRDLRKAQKLIDKFEEQQRTVVSRLAK